MSLADLPQELLLQTLGLTKPYGFECFMSTCKYVYEAGRPLLKHYNALRRKYRQLKLVSGRKPRDGLTSIQQLLYLIADNPEIAAYIVDLELGEHYWQGHITHNQKLAAQDNDGLLRLLRSSPYLDGSHANDNDDCVQAWFKGIIDEESCEVEKDWATVFLLTLLTNLEVLQLPTTWKKDDTCDPKNQTGKVLQCIVTNANNPSLTDQPLGKLRVLKPTWRKRNQFAKSMPAVEPFLAIQSLREFYCAGLALDEYASMKGIYGPMSKNLEIIEMNDVIVWQFREGMSSLKVLKIHYGEKDEHGYDWEPDRLLFAIENHVGKHLETSSLTYGCIRMEDIVPSRGYQRWEFERLRELELDTRLFLNQWKDPEEDGLDELHDDKHVPALIDLIPSSVQHLHLLTHATSRSNACLGRLFAGFTGLAKEPLPLLKSVVVLRGHKDDYGHVLEDHDSELPENVRALVGSGSITISETSEYAAPDFVQNWENRFNTQPEF